MATLIDPLEEATAEVFTQDGNGNWIVDEESKNSRDFAIFFNLFSFLCAKSRIHG